MKIKSIEGGKKLLLKLTAVAQASGGKGFRQYTTKKNGGGKVRKPTWVQSVSNQVGEF